MDLPRQDLLGQRITDGGLDEAAQGTRAVRRLVPLVDQPLQCLVADIEGDPSISETPLQLIHLEECDPLQLLLIQWIEHHHGVQTVEELRAEVLTHHRHHLLLPHVVRLTLVDKELRSHIGREDEYRVAEVNGATLAVGETTIVEHL